MPGFTPITVHHSSSTRPSTISFTTHASGTASKETSSKGGHCAKLLPFHCLLPKLWSQRVLAWSLHRLWCANISMAPQVHSRTTSKEHPPCLTRVQNVGDSKAKARTFVSTPASISLAVKNNQGVQAGQGCMQPGAWRGCKKSAW